MGEWAADGQRQGARKVLPSTGTTPRGAAVCRAIGSHVARAEVLEEVRQNVVMARTWGFPGGTSASHRSMLEVGSRRQRSDERDSCFSRTERASLQSRFGPFSALPPGPS